jgi:thiamine kinase-like enzyme
MIGLAPHVGDLLVLENMSTHENRIRDLAFFASEPVMEVTPVADGKGANYIATTALRKYFVKTRTLKRDRYHSVDIRHEYAALRAVGEAGLGPRALHISADGRTLVMEYLEGTPCQSTSIKSEANLPRAARALRQLHAVDPLGVRYHFEAVLDHYLLALSGNPLLTADGVESVRWVLALCQQSVGHARLAMCHGDLGAQNLMESEGIKFIDLEMAGENDLHFDVAMFILFNGLSAEEETRFLGMYGTGVHLERLRHVKLAVSAREGLWALSEITDGKTDALYPHCASAHLATIDRARRA